MTSVSAQLPFTVGDWTVVPARRLIRAGAEEITLEPRVIDLLICLARHAGEVVSPDELVAEVWDGRIVSDSPIYQTLAKLRKALGDDRTAPRFVETIPKRGYRLIAEVTWPEEELRPGPAGGAQSDPAAPSRDAVRALRQRGAWLSMLLITTLYVILASSDVATTSPISAPNRPEYMSIAILPLADMSEDGRLAYLGDGISEQLIHTLSELPQLRVIARTSSFSFRDSSEDVVAIAQRLGVDLVLEGSVRTSGEQLRVSTQLIDGQDAFHVWSRTFERPMTDVFEIQDAIAREVAGLIIWSDVDTGEVDLRQATHDPRAWELYLLGNHQMHLRHADSLERAIDYFEEAVEADPAFAKAYADLSYAWFLASERRFGRVPSDVAMEEAELAARQALAMDDSLAAAWTSLYPLLEIRGESEAAEEAILRAYELNPGSAEVNKVYAFYLLGQNRLEETTAAMETAVELDPLSWNYRQNLAAYYNSLGRFEESHAQIERAMELRPDFHQPFLAGAFYAYFAGRYDLAVRRGAHAATVEGPDARGADSAAWLTASAWFALGDFGEARRWLAYARDASKPQWSIDQLELRILLAEYRDDEAHRLLESWVERVPDDGDSYRGGAMIFTSAYAYAFAAQVEVMLGHEAHGRELFERALLAADAGERVALPIRMTQLLRWGYLPAATQTLLLDRAGDESASSALAHEALAFLASSPRISPFEPGTVYAIATVHGASGARSKALSQLEVAVDAGWGLAWYTRRDPNLALLRDDTRFEALLARIEKGLAAQRQALADDPVRAGVGPR